jgi:hypothetical protein
MADGDSNDKGTPPPTDQTPAEEPTGQGDADEQSLADTDPVVDHVLGSEDRGERFDPTSGARPRRRDR